MNKHQQTRISARRSDFTRLIGIYLAIFDDRSKTIAIPQAISVRTYKQEDPMPSENPIVEITDADAAQWMDALWNAGIRPTNGAGSVGELAATKAHLEDFRALVFGMPTEAPGHTTQATSAPSKQLASEIREDSERERPKFEAWARNGIPLDTARNSDGEYIYEGTRCAWQAWQGKLESPEHEKNYLQEQLKASLEAFTKLNGEHNMAIAAISRLEKQITDARQVAEVHPGSWANRAQVAERELMHLDAILVGRAILDSFTNRADKVRFAVEHAKGADEKIGKLERKCEGLQDEVNKLDSLLKQRTAKLNELADRCAGWERRAMEELNKRDALEKSLRCQPISTAPKDGTAILMADEESNCPVVGRWDETQGKWVVAWDDSDYMLVGDAKWMAIPNVEQFQPNVPQRCPDCGSSVRNVASIGCYNAWHKTPMPAAALAMAPADIERALDQHAEDSSVDLPVPQPS